MTELILASSNKEKIDEIKAIFKSSQIKIKSLLDCDEVLHIEETGNSFFENAKIKAEAAFNRFHIPSVGDDSGLQVEQLNGEPGIYSARYSGEDSTYHKNNLKLLDELKNFAEPHRANYICTAVYYDGKQIISAEGRIFGRIIKNFRGSFGFGYDPVFIPDGYDITMAEMSPEEKNKISHRRIAFEKLKESLKTLQL